ncbi:roadblock/LC7 domain-containing protein [Nocardiopsis sp. MG754419]|uniref:roadblock/LC7 domain-containing protein n=1 Tax=Nocardiopsis sp. MG754419 TaxID=2259865 RepID=UPI001BA6584B|nr:roadblock/LC7 domain-containing protein [Nocardiopsis sp. MG754419]MBR8745343.1 roadblock/LC7 domain-containing protein [Nocardiopsis sp. MG754419]
MPMSADTAAQDRDHGQDPGWAAQRLNWLMGDLVERVGGARHALLLSTDGLPLSISPDLDQESAERLAAIAAGFASLARGARRELGAAEVRQSVVEMDNVFFFVLSAGQGAQLALVAVSDCDMGQAAFEVNRLVRQVGPYLSALPRGRRERG